MSPEPLHHSLGPMPLPKPVCLGCHVGESAAVLAPIRNSKTLFLCLTCAGMTWADANAELFRRTYAALSDAISPQVVS